MSKKIEKPEELVKITFRGTREQRKRLKQMALDRDLEGGYQQLLEEMLAFYLKFTAHPHAKTFGLQDLKALQACLQETVEEVGARKAGDER